MFDGNKSTAGTKKDQSSDDQTVQDDVASVNETLQHGDDGRSGVSTQRYAT